MADKYKKVSLRGTAILSSTYFGPIQWYQKLYRYDCVLIEQHESFIKQTYRNRCIIATTQGTQALTVPVEHSPYDANNVQGPKSNVQSIRLSDHGNWRHLHWQALQSAYGESPFFEYYEDDLRPFFFSREWEFLLDYNEAICRKMCQLLDICPKVEHTSEYQKDIVSTTDDYRDVIRPKNPLPDLTFQPRRYYQVYEQKHGFLPNLSILDLLFNMGPESIFYL